MQLKIREFAFCGRHFVPLEKSNSFSGNNDSDNARLLTNQSEWYIKCASYNAAQFEIFAKFIGLKNTASKVWVGEMAFESYNAKY